MSKQANSKLIGGFVVGAIVLVVAGVLLFGSGKFFSHQKEFVLFFEDDVKGLNIGAPVDFRGVNIGTVKDVKIVLNKEDFSLHIPVFIEIDPNRMVLGGEVSELRKLVEQREKKTFIQLLIKRGLRAQLAMQSLVTGQLGVHLDFFPDEPVRLVGAEPGYTEIPTVQSTMSEITKTLQNLPIAEIAAKVVKTLDGIDKLVTSQDIKDTLASLTPTVKSAHELLKNVNNQVKPLSTSAEGTMSEAKKMLASAEKLADSLNSRIPALIASIEKTSNEAGVTMKGANGAIERLAGQNSAVRLELIKALTEFSATARSVRVLAQYLESHPEALIKGKGK